MLFNDVDTADTGYGPDDAIIENGLLHWRGTSRMVKLAPELRDAYMRLFEIAAESGD